LSSLFSKKDRYFFKFSKYKIVLITNVGIKGIGVLTNNGMKCYIPLFHHSIIPGGNTQNGWMGIPYYQAFLEIPINRVKCVVNVLKRGMLT